MGSVPAARNKQRAAPALEMAPGALFAPVRVRKTAEVVADDIRRMILSGRLKEGDTLQSEARIIAKFAVSRPTLREAFRILESERLISISRGSRGGARVHAPCADLVARHAGFVLQSRRVSYGDVYQARLIVEPPAARMAAQLRAKDGPAILREVIERERVVRGSDAFGKAIADFHAALMMLSGNQTLILLCSVLDGIVARHQAQIARDQAARDTGEPKTGRGLSTAIKSHEKLVALIEAGDGPGAEAHWRKHMEIAGKIWLADSAGAAPVIWGE